MYVTYRYLFSIGQLFMLTIMFKYGGRGRACRFYTDTPHSEQVLSNRFCLLANARLTVARLNTVRTMRERRF